MSRSWSGNHPRPPQGPRWDIWFMVLTLGLPLAMLYLTTR